MKHIILIIVGFFIFTAGSLSAEIGVIKELHGRRPAFNKFKIDRKVLMDMNHNGSPDIVVIRNNVLYVFDSKTKEKLWEFTLTAEIHIESSFVIFGGFAIWDDTDIVHVILGIVDSTDESISYTVIINTQTNEIVYNDIGRPVAVLNLPNGKTAVVSYVGQGNIYRIIGILVALKVSNNTSHHPIKKTSEYSISLKFKSDPGLQLGYDPDLFDSPEDGDFDGDGYADIPMLTVENGDVSGMVVRGGDNLGLIWNFTFPEKYKTNLLKGFHGFADINGDGVKEAILGDNLAVTLDGTVNVIAENFQIQSIEDVDNDGYDDIIGLNTKDSTVEVYGFQNTTSAAENNRQRIAFKLFQNFPNPFNPSTDISFSTAKAGEIELDIYNILGQKVRNLLTGYKPAGNYTLTWNGRNDSGILLSSGRYIYSLKIGENVQTRKMVFLK